MQSADDFETILASRLEIAQKERLAIRETCNQIDAKLRSHINQLVERPKESAEQVSQAIEDLEYKHSTTTQTNAEERNFMRTLEKYRQKKKAIVYFDQLQIEVDEMKSKRGILLQELKDKDKTIDELYLGLRKIKTAQRLKCNTFDLVEDLYKVPDDMLPKVIGKGGHTLSQVEVECGVNIQSDRTGASELRVMGTPASIAMAFRAIDNIIRTVTEELTPSEEAIVCLIIDKGALVQDIQTRHGVRIDVSKGKRSCKINGFASAVEAAKSEILALNCARTVISINPSMLPFIVGKGGATIRSIGESNRVSIDIERDANKIVIAGLKDGVQNATKIIISIVEDNREIEEVVRAQKQTLIGCIIGGNGQIIRSIQTEFTVNLRSEKGVDGELDSLFIRGTTSRVLAAKQHILETIAEYSSKSEEVVVPDECMSIILGKKGSKIKVLREEHPTVNLDVDENIIRIRGGTAEARAKAKSVIDAILLANYVRSTSFDQEMAALFKSSKGIEVRQHLVSNLHLVFDIDAEKQVMRLRGQKNSVDSGISYIKTFISESHTVYLDLEDEDCASLMNGGHPNPGEAKTVPKSDPEFYIHSPTRYIELKYGVDVFMNRKDCKLRLRGPTAAVDAAAMHIRGLLGGELRYGSLLVAVDPVVYAALIGKSGSNLKKMEAELIVKFDILKSKSLLRIRGDSSKIPPAKAAVLEFLNNVRAVLTVPVPATFAGKDRLKMVDTLEAAFDVEIILNANEATIKGPLLVTEEAKICMNEIVTNSSTWNFKLLPHQVQIVERHQGKEFNPIAAKHGVKFEVVSQQPPKIVVSGIFNSVAAAKSDFLKALHSIFPKEIAHVQVKPSALRILGSSKAVREIAEVSGADVVIDRESSFIILCAPASALAAAVEIFKKHLQSWESNHHTINIEEFMLPLLVGKNGSTISALEKAAGVSINVSRQNLCLEIESANPAVLKNSIEVITAKVEKIRKEYFEFIVEDSLMGSLIGKQGATIKKFREDLKASIDLDFSTRKLAISGKEEHVAEAKNAIMKFLEEEKTRFYHQNIFVPGPAIPMLIGVKGANVKEIQEATGVRVELDKSTEKGVLRGSPDACAKACEMILDILEREGFGRISLTPPPAVVVATTISPTDGSDNESEDLDDAKPTAKGTPGLKVEPKLISKSALRRKRRKEKQTLPNGGDDEDDEAKEEAVEDPAPRVNSIEDPPTIVTPNAAEVFLHASVSTIEEADDEPTMPESFNVSSLNDVNESAQSLPNFNLVSLDSIPALPSNLVEEMRIPQTNQRPPLQQINVQPPAIPQESSRLLNVLLGKSSRSEFPNQSASISGDSNYSASRIAPVSDSLNLGYNYEANMPYFSSMGNDFNSPAVSPPGFLRNNVRPPIGLQGLHSEINAGNQNLYSSDFQNAQLVGSGIYHGGQPPYANSYAPHDAYGRQLATGFQGQYYAPVAQQTGYPVAPSSGGLLPPPGLGVPLATQPQSVPPNRFPIQSSNINDGTARPMGAYPQHQSIMSSSGPANGYGSMQASTQQIQSSNEKNQNVYFTSKSGLAVRL